MLINTPTNLTKWQYKKNKSLYLMESDSWGYYPGEKSKIVNPYDLSTSLSDRMDIYNFGMFGDTIRNISKDENIKYIEDRLGYVLHSNSKSNIIKGFILSAGGNDLFDNLVNIFQSSTTLEGYINYDSLNKFFEDVRGYFKKFIFGCKNFLRDDIKFYIHTYDYVIDIGDGFESWFTKIKPWAFPKLEKVGIKDKKDGIKIMKIIIDKYYEFLLTMKNEIDGLHIIDLRGTLTDLKYWENEIHPNKEGFEILGDKIYKLIKENE